MNRDPQKTRKIIGGIIIAVILVGSIIVLLALPGKNKQTPQSQDTTTNNSNGTATQGQGGVQYVGFVELSKYGFTSYQMEGIRYILYQYAKNANNFTINAGTIKQGDYDPNSTADYIPVTFTLKIDNKSYTARVDKYLDLTSIRVYLFVGSSATPAVYDSQVIDTTKLQNQTPTSGESAGD
jgi:hypothetical protein